MSGSESNPCIFESRRSWEDWLEANHGDSAGIWLRIGKKNMGLLSISYEEALEAALCYGWIDALKKKFDAISWIQRFTPRKPGSGWSKINREKAEALIEAGLMHPAGIRAVDEARRNGKWEKAYDPQRTIDIPSDLEAEFSNKPLARMFFESLDSRNRYAILHRIQVAMKPETRAARIEKFVAMLEDQKKVYP